MQVLTKVLESIGLSIKHDFLAVTHPDRLRKMLGLAVPVENLLRGLVIPPLVNSPPVFMLGKYKLMKNHHTLLA